MLENTEGAKKKGQSRETGNTEGQRKRENPEKLATYSTQDTGQTNVREHRRGKEKGTIQRNWQHTVHKTQDKYMLENTEGAKKKGQSRETGNIRYTRHRISKR
jgi:hypothetical protein